eukprot:CAMPEP_0197031846 /NCGR_PEP_ID=MMETSP1384-20130603/10702_1 /TAXON_ID=29189 /ORGANISM="Ammonia sp." /LENGTH=538 /DNA_ID=CAMNT_0042461423 /DNA_START=9 /DNA_END=1625 /DNA_ORIENTATION=-
MADKQSDQLMPLTPLMVPVSPRSPPSPASRSMEINQSDTQLTPHTSMQSMGALLGLNSPVLSPRRSITPRQAIDVLELGVTQANDLQHLLDKYAKQTEQHSLFQKIKIAQQFEHITKELTKRQEMLVQQVDAWKSEKLITVSEEINRAAEYEKLLKKAQEQCRNIEADDKMQLQQKRKEIRQIKNGLYAGDKKEEFKKYTDSQLMTQHINNIVRLVDIEYQATLPLADLGKYGEIQFVPNNSVLSIPTVVLEKPIKVRQSKCGYKLKLKWTTSLSLNPDNFIIRCFTVADLDLNDQDDEKVQAKKRKDTERWKSLIFQLTNPKSPATVFETKDIESVFVFDKVYNLRVEYHLTDPINLLIGSNEEIFCIENRPPEGNKAEFIPLEYVSHRGNAYEGHPKNLLLDGNTKKYRSIANEAFGYAENDRIVFKIKHSGVARQYLPKVVLIKNASGLQSVRRLTVSIAGSADAKEWHSYNEIELKNDHHKLQQFALDGVDWRICKEMKDQYIKLELIENYGENRGQQCRFKFHEFQLFGQEFQ